MPWTLAAGANGRSKRNHGASARAGVVPSGHSTGVHNDLHHTAAAAIRPRMPSVTAGSRTNTSLAPRFAPLWRTTARFWGSCVFMARPEPTTSRAPSASRTTRQYRLPFGRGGQNRSGWTMTRQSRSQRSALIWPDVREREASRSMASDPTDQLNPTTWRRAGVFRCGRSKLWRTEPPLLRSGWNCCLRARIDRSRVREANRGWR